MFNAGIIGSKSHGPLVKLTSRFIGFSTYPQVSFYSDGIMHASGVGYVTGEWYVTGPIHNIGLSYQIRYTLQAGVAPLAYSNDTVETVWTDIAGEYYGRRVVWGEGASGRILIEIRDKTTQEIKSSAQFWSNASSAP